MGVFDVVVWLNGGLSQENSFSNTRRTESKPFSFTSQEEAHLLHEFLSDIDLRRHAINLVLLKKSKTPIPLLFWCTSIDKQAIHANRTTTKRPWNLQETTSPGDQISIFL